MFVGLKRRFSEHSSKGNRPEAVKLGLGSECGSSHGELGGTGGSVGEGGGGDHDSSRSCCLHASEQY